MVGWNVTKLHTVTADGIVMILMGLGMLKLHVYFPLNSFVLCLALC